MLFVVLEVVEPDMMLVLMVLIAKFKEKGKKRKKFSIVEGNQVIFLLELLILL